MPDISLDQGIDQAVADQGVDQTIGTDGPGIGIFVGIPVGTFTMGSPWSGEACRESQEKPHQVQLTRAFWLQSTEVTQSQFQGVMGYNPSQFVNCGGDCPVEQVTWHEAVAYCNALSISEGLPTCFTCTGTEANTTCTVKSTYTGTSHTSCKGYRLPTEAEWEYAYRAGTTSAYYNGTNDPQQCCGIDATLGKIAWYGRNSVVTYSGCVAWEGACIGPHPVGGKTPNAWGLYDMAGNIAEYVYEGHGPYSTTGPSVDPAGSTSGANAMAIVRGGAWSGCARDCRAASRAINFPTTRLNAFGFRCARTK